MPLLTLSLRWIADVSRQETWGNTVLLFFQYWINSYNWNVNQGHGMRLSWQLHCMQSTKTLWSDVSLFHEVYIICLQCKICPESATHRLHRINIGNAHLLFSEPRNAQRVPDTTRIKMRTFAPLGNSVTYIVITIYVKMCPRERLLQSKLRQLS